MRFNESNKENWFLNQLINLLKLFKRNHNWQFIDSHRQQFTAKVISAPNLKHGAEMIITKKNTQLTFFKTIL